MKQFLTLFIVILISFTLVACHENPENTQTSEKPEDITNEIKNTDIITNSSQNNTYSSTETKKDETDIGETENSSLITPENEPLTTASPSTEGTPSTGTTTNQPQCNHVYTDATCTTPKTCVFCGDTAGDASYHNWLYAGDGNYRLFCQSCKERYTCQCGFQCKTCDTFLGDLCNHYADHWKIEKSHCPHKYQKDVNSTHHFIRCWYCDDIKFQEEHTWIQVGRIYECTGCSISSNSLPIRVQSVLLDKTILSLNVGDTQQLMESIFPEEAKNKSVTWSSNNDSVAQVSPTGAVTATGKGSAIITVTTFDGNFAATCTVTVTESSTTPVAEVLIIDKTQTISNQTIETDVYITSTGIVTLNNITVHGNIYCYGQLNADNCTANNVYAYAYGAMMTCDAFDGTHGKVNGDITCNNLTIRNEALDYAFNEWGKK